MIRITLKPNLDDKRFVYVGVPITGLTVEALGARPRIRARIFSSSLDRENFHPRCRKLARLIKRSSRAKTRSIVNTAIMAFTAGYAYPVGKVLTHQYRFEHIPKTDGRAQITMDGNQALAYGLIAAGVRYGAGYPRLRKPSATRPAPSFLSVAAQNLRLGNRVAMFPSQRTMA